MKTEKLRFEKEIEHMKSSIYSANKNRCANDKEVMFYRFESIYLYF